MSRRDTSLSYHSPAITLWAFQLENAFLDASNEDMPVTPIRPFSKRRRDWDDDEEWDF